MTHYNRGVWDLSQIRKALVFTRGDVSAAAELVSGPKTKRPDDDTADEDAPASKVARISDEDEWKNMLPDGGKLLVLDYAIDGDTADEFMLLVKEQIDRDRELSEGWMSPMVEDARVVFKGDMKLAKDISNKPEASYWQRSPRVKPTTRLSANMGRHYFYSNKFHAGIPLGETAIGEFIERVFFPLVEKWVNDNWEESVPPPGRPNNVLVNYYETYEGSIGAHSDRTEGNLNPETDPVVMISFGASRKWRLRSKKTTAEKKQPLDFWTKNRQAVIMMEPMQQNWTHEVPAVKGDALFQNALGISTARVSLTFRWLKSVPSDRLEIELQKAEENRKRNIAIYTRERERETPGSVLEGGQ